MPDGVAGSTPGGPTSAATRPAIAMANATTASDPSPGRAAACGSVSVPANAAVRMAGRSHDGSAADVTPDDLHGRRRQRNA